MKEEILGYLLIKKILIFQLVIAIFKHIFELLWALRNVLHILVCHSGNSWWNPDYHTPISRGYPELSYGSNSLNICCVIRELELEETFRWISPRTWIIRPLEREKRIRNEDGIPCRLSSSRRVSTRILTSFRRSRAVCGISLALVVSQFLKLRS